MLMGFVSIAFSQTDTTKTDSVVDRTIPTFSSSLDALEDENGESQDVSGLLQSSRDVFNSVAGFNFSAARYRIRGYDSENYITTMNGVTLNNAETDRAIWALWGGLNDVTRNQEIKNGIAASPYVFGGVGGSSNINARPTAIRKGTNISYALSNQTYQHRLMFTHSTGMMKDGWAIAVSGSGRYSDEGYVDGTFFRGGSYFISIEKKLSEKHSLGFVSFGSPTVQGRTSINTDEIHTLTDDNFYNSYWGYQDGEKRNSRVRNTHQPYFMLNHYFNVNKKTQITSSIFTTTGRSGNTRINWDEANDPRPEYWRNLPSAFNKPGDEIAFANQTALWQSLNPTTTQLNWDQFYFANSKNLFTVDNVDGKGTSLTGNRAKYIVEEQRSDVTEYGANTAINHKLNDKMTLSGGARLSIYKSENFKVVNDLLGANFWLDVNQFPVQGNSNPDVLQSDLDQPNKIAREGDRFGYDYDININTANAFAQLEGTTTKIDYFVGGSISHTSFWRTGNVKNGLFPQNSLGDSDKENFLNFGVKGGAVYKLTGRHLFTVNGAYLTRAPQAQNAFISPRTRNEIVDNLKSEKVYSGDINYIVRYPKVKIRATAFYTKVQDETWKRSFYHDQLRSFVNFVMTGVDKLYTGFEFGAEVNLTSTLTATATLAGGDYTYDSRPLATVAQDNSAKDLEKDKLIYLENFKLAETPQMVGSIGLRYRSPKYWFVGVDFNYFNKIYVQVNPDRRSENVVTNLVNTDPQISQILDQTELSDDYTLNMYAGKSWKIKNYFIRININVNNVLDNKDFRTGGFEQLRYDKTDIDKFPPMIGYSLGRTYFAMLAFSF